MNVAWSQLSSRMRMVLLVALPFGCEQGTDRETATPAAVPPHTTPSAWEVTARTITTEDGPRHFIVSRPRDALRGPGRPAVVLVLHGGGMNGAAMRAYADLETRAGPRAIFVYPDAIVRNVWADEYALHWDGTRDLSFIDAIVRSLTEKAQASGSESTVAQGDPARVYAFGLSSGAYFANQLACAWGKRIAAFVAIEGGGPYGACSGPVNALIVHDPADPVVPASEGKESLTRWLAEDGCAPAAEPWPVGAPRGPSAGGCRVHACADGARVATCSPAVGVHGIGPGVREASLRFFNL